MIINTQAFASRAENRGYDELDDFQSRKPVTLSAATARSSYWTSRKRWKGCNMAALPQFNPLMILRYSATHRTNHLKIHRLDALDAYNQKLVKISVQGQTRSRSTNAYLYLEGIDISKQAPVAGELEVKLKSGEIKGN